MGNKKGHNYDNHGVTQLVLLISTVMSDNYLRFQTYCIVTKKILIQNMTDNDDESLESDDITSSD
jgi:hypothetical protein